MKYDEDLVQLYVLKISALGLKAQDGHDIWNAILNSVESAREEFKNATPPDPFIRIDNYRAATFAVFKQRLIELFDNVPQEQLLYKDAVHSAICRVG